MSQFRPKSQSAARSFAAFVSIPLILSAFLFFPLTAALADSIKLKNGKVLEGHIAAWNDTRTEIYFAMDDDDEAEPQWMPVSEIESIRYSGLAPIATIKKKNTPVPPKAAA